MITGRMIRLLFALMLSAALPASARDIEGIAVVVNDEVISLYDVDQRVDLFFATSGIKKSPEMTERMRGQVLRALVDEKLQLQEANRVEIEIEQTEIEERMELLADQDSMTLDGIKDFLKKSAIEEDTLKAQIRAELAWNQFVRRSFGGRIKVGDREIDEQYDKAVKAVNQTRYLVSEILLNLD
ncbi:MAG: SurA N-terminal domain-containing protein, partial [Alphaproteobacteria bacterium]|nr:SurA N-terminal domain-containing protein [Alphaproteobacteria bacterium]